MSYDIDKFDRDLKRLVEEFFRYSGLGFKKLGLGLITTGIKLESKSKEYRAERLLEEGLNAK